ncbi:hypothetical protein M5E06_10485 [Azospirillum sp. A1-3]|uniref:hypothetical protein n=1 Tax=Azospirillum sp. A1-3 TaxID=185874 RepID=UPI0020777BA5|nr:hypothetical protein [Azospirillum sp. A1-3]MCM8734621.1 hypothetical protein [Azospirillum sp. A1-3]
MTTDTIEQPSTAVATLDMTALVPTHVFAPGGVDAILEKLETDVRASAKDLDISTAKGRKEVASLAYKVARSKTALDDMGKALVADIKAQASAIDADRRTVRDRLDKLRDEVRKPLDEFEAAEAARIKAHEDRIHAITCLSMDGAVTGTDAIAARLEEARAIDTSGFQEFAKRAEDAKADTVAKLEAMLQESQQRDAERAELERLRQEAAERAAREKAERIEREAKEREERAAEQARREAEEKARLQAEEVERRAAAERERIEREAREKEEAAERERQRVERERAEAEERAAQAERDRLAAEQRAKEAEEKAERDRVEAERRAEEARKAAEQRAQRQAEEAARLERERIEAQQRADEEAARRREADKAHRASINRAALEAFVAAGLSEGAARTAVEAIAKGNVPNVRISY